MPKRFEYLRRPVRALRALSLVAFVVTVSPIATGQPADDAHPYISSVEACAYTPFLSTARNFADLVSRSDPFIGNFDARVTVVEYFDPNCSHCKNMHPIMEELIQRYSDHVRFFMIPFPLWPHSLLQIEALYVAAAKNKYYEMLSAQFEVQKSGGLSLAELKELAAGLDIDPDWMQARLEEGRHLEQIMTRHRQIQELGVRSTPTIMINGRFITESESKTLACIGKLIEEALTSTE